MAIPVYLQQFKSAGIYRVTFDKSTVLGQDTNILRLVVGYSEVGPFNTPVYVTSVSDFKAIYGDISKKLEKRGIYFHRIALQCLASGPILCLNLKKFAGETVSASSIHAGFNPSYEPIDTVEVNVEDIYDTTRFWTLSADKLNEIADVNGRALTGYIRICATNTANTSVTYFIRKASGSKVTGYNVTVSDWYKDSGEDVPEYLSNKLNSLISDFFAEIYVFKGEFVADQVLASETLHNYFEVVNGKLQLKKSLDNVYGEPVDVLDELYHNSTSGALSHYVGCTIPYFKDKIGNYQSLDILFNNDVETNNLMMAFDIDNLEDGMYDIDLSGHTRIPASLAEPEEGQEQMLLIKNLFDGTATSNLLGNMNATVVSGVVEFAPEYRDVKATGEFGVSARLTGNYYAKEITPANSGVAIKFADVSGEVAFTINTASEEETDNLLIKLGINKAADGTNYYGGVYSPNASKVKALDDDGDTEGTIETIDTDNEYFAIENLPDAFLVSISNYLSKANKDNKTIDYTSRLTLAVEATSVATKTTLNVNNSVYGSSVSFVPKGNWTQSTSDKMLFTSTDDKSLVTYFAKGDCVLAKDGTTDADYDGNLDAADGYFDNVYVQEVGSNVSVAGVVTYYVKFTGEPLIYNDYLVRLDGCLNQEIGVMSPVFMSGYTYKNSKPASTSMRDKLNYQNFILSALTDYKGIRTGLLNKSDIDYRYIIDTFESFVGPGCKNVLSFLAKEKQSAFAILNFPAVQTFIKCPYASFTDAKGVFNVEYVVKGYNPQKSHASSFGIPSDAEGASFCAFYTPLKFSDGYVDTFVPSAGIVSNLFMEKYMSRQPYYIIAGPNYGAITASGLIGPDYNYSRAELNVIEPFGVNCMVYRPSFGTFINANQTAKQTPVSALSKVHVRELVIYLQDEIEKILQQFQWEFNNQTVRNKILDKANAICSQIQKNGGLQDYLNIMDESNNTPEIIDNEMAILSTHIEPGRGMGKMVHELTLYRTGEMRSSINE